ncbi:hypothetical protein [Sulfurivirga sp.]|uniref:hypothetical protein n=1 Tax=Sulfurivirga sp. TaxID=2614236 RepID=UPI0025CF0583|nr:hypothetical protein [Sulfurivirga sp.]
MSVESMAAFARRLGVARSTVTRWAKAGRIELAPNGKVRVEESLRLLERTRGGRPDVAERHAKKRGRALPQAPDGPERGTEADEVLPSGGASLKTDGTPIDVEGALARYRAQALKFRNSLTKLEIALERGEWLSREDHHRQMGELGRRLRQSLENLADLLAPRMAAGLVDGAALEAEIGQIIEEVLA